MNYIIENANVVSDNGISTISLLIEKNRIAHYGKTLKRYKSLRINVSSYFMTPGHIFCEYELSQTSNLPIYKERLQTLIKKGCTTVIVPCNIRYESEFQQKIKEARHSMINSTIDYVIGVHLPLEKLTPTTIRLCKRYNLPFIIVDVYEHDNIFSVPWGWLREAQYQYQVPIYPIWKSEDQKVVRQQMDDWQDATSANHIPTYMNFPTNQIPLSKVVLKQIGLYPKKGELLIGNDIDYNLYIYRDSELGVDEKNKLDYHKINPIITVHKGRLLRVEDEMNFYPGFGEELKVKIPGLFGTIEIEGKLVER